MTVTYRTGYGTTRRTLADLNAWSRFANLHPEFRRRLIALMNESFRHGRDLGIGGGFRSYAEQRSLFLARHHKVATGGCCSFEGARWALDTGEAHAAKPGNSYHEETPNVHVRRLDGSIAIASQFGIAADMVGWQDGWMEANLARFDLKSLKSSTVSPEPWHVFPIEVPASRSRFDGNVHILVKRALP